MDNRNEEEEVEKLLKKQIETIDVIIEKINKGVGDFTIEMSEFLKVRSSLERVYGEATQGYGITFNKKIVEIVETGFDIFDRYSSLLDLISVGDAPWNNTNGLLAKDQTKAVSTFFISLKMQLYAFKVDCEDLLQYISNKAE